MKTRPVHNRYSAFLLLILGVFSLSVFVPLATAANNSSSETVANLVEWKSIIFGQSTSMENNSITTDKAEGTVRITAGSKDGSTAGGKVTGSHDGIAYYYTEIDSSKNFELSAVVKVNFFAKPTPDRQEAFPYTTLFRSDISGMGAVMEDVFHFRQRPANDGSAAYLLKLKKTNTGYHAAVDNSREQIYYRPKQLEILNPNRIYVGFFAARVASITVSEIAFKTSEVATDPPGVAEPPKPVSPWINVVSLSTASLSSYNLNVLTNVKGRLEINQEEQSIYNGPVEKAGNFIKNVTLVKGHNTFNLLFTPDSTENITSNDTIRISHQVTYKTYGKAGGAIYISPTGRSTATGGKRDPIDIYSAVQFLQPGQTIYVRGGVYNLTVPVVIPRGNDGLSGKPKVLSAYRGEQPVFDFAQKSSGLLLAGDHWTVRGIDITRAKAHGFKISGNYNLVEQVNTYANGDTGLQVSAAFPEDKTEQWPSHNLILNCTSYDNRDPAENNADGFAAKLTCGPGNVFRGCIAHHNCDDGYDLYSKLETGPISPVTIENCIAYENGILSNGSKTKGDGNGFKMGGEGLAVKHILKNCLAYKNGSAGVTSNSDPAIIVENTTSVDNGSVNFDFSYYSNAIPQFIAKNNISFRTAAGREDLFPACLGTDDNYFFNGVASVNAVGKQVLASDFKSVTPAFFERNADGTIAANDYMALIPTTSIAGGFQVKSPAKKRTSTGK